MKRWTLFSTVVAALVITLGAVRCGKDSAKSDLSTAHSGTYKGSGSVWTLTMNADKSFTLVKQATVSSTSNERSISGNYETYSTGFYKFTISSCSGTGCPSGSAVMYGFSVPGLVMVIKPDGDSETMVLPAFTSTCPTGDVNFNWVEAAVSDDVTNLRTHDFWGNATITAGGAFSGKKWYIDTANGSEMNVTGPTSGTCSNGIFTLSGLSDAFTSLTSGGFGIVQTSASAGEDAIIAIPRQTDITIANSIAGKSFAGIVFNKGASGDDASPVNGTFNGSGEGTYSVLSNIETGATSETGTVNAVATGSGQKAGFLKFAVNPTATTHPRFWAAVANNVGGRTFIFGAGFNTNSGETNAGTDPFSLVMIEK